MPRWLFYSLVTILLWGVWGFLGKLSDARVPMNALVVQALMTVGLLPAVIAAAISPTGWAGRNRRRGIAFAFLTGLIACLANTATYKAYTEGGPASIVLPVAAVYPVLTVLAAWGFLGEKVNRVQLAGIAVGMIGVALLGVAAGGDSTAGALAALRHAWNQPWMFWTMIALLGQAAAGITQKLSTDDLAPEGSFVAFAAAFVVVAGMIALASMVKYDFPWAVGRKGWIVCVSIGLAAGFGVLASFAAYRYGKAAVVTPMTGLYPVVSTLLAVPLLGEHFGMKAAIGTALALGGAAAMSYEKRREVIATAAEVSVAGPALADVEQPS
jgi:transporter family protein